MMDDLFIIKPGHNKTGYKALNDYQKIQRFPISKNYLNTMIGYYVWQY